MAVFSSISDPWIGSGRDSQTLPRSAQMTSNVFFQSGLANLLAVCHRNVVVLMKLCRHLPFVADVAEALSGLCDSLVTKSGIRVERTA